VGQKCDLVEVSLDQERVDRAVRAVTHMTKTIEKGIRLKNRDSCYFCPFKGTPHCT
jgi:CRISPR/Cas system-associated exonuclease Cas4 (RecB family)